MDDLSQALEVLRLSTISGDQASNAIGTLAHASRHDETARQRLGKPEILKNLTETIECSINDSLEVVDSALRCIGNACIDNNNARENLTAIGFSWALQALATAGDSSRITQVLAVKTLYNVCCDYEPAQQRCLSDLVHYSLIRVGATTPVVQSIDAALLVELLYWICSHKQPDQSALPAEVLMKLISLPGLYHKLIPAEDFTTLLETCLLFVRDVEMQRVIIEHQQVDRIWTMLKNAEELFKTLEPSNDDAKFLLSSAASLTWALSDITARSEFAAAYGLQSSFIQDVILPIVQSQCAPTSTRYLAAAYQILGNLLWLQKDPRTFEYVIKADFLHQPVLDNLFVSNPDLQHAGVGLLVQLSRASVEARETIGADARTTAALELLCKHDRPELRQDGMTLLRALGRDCSVNQERFGRLARDLMQSTHSEDSRMAG